ncbi:glycosyltransferase [Cyanobacterium aponinum]|uniref:glycosyltransferase n=1 Tax=Cyanobacterium aponinum TaxID=379064 RepID=UPI000C12A4E1|nr:glycosyltransferase [Cyanobacterium aponinum]PHV63860.1 hypothetical protein CSQ80_03360 [Cyanobacterium aponinum IPPAS B-1201]
MNLYFLFPQMHINSGGHIAQMKFMAIAQSLTNAYPVTYERKEKDVLYLEDIIRQTPTANSDIYVIHWGPHINKLLTKLKHRNVVYIAHSTGYKFKIPPQVPIIAVSKHSQAYWGRYAPNSLIFHLPNEISPQYQNWHQERPIDVLVQKRKSSQYLLKQLIPALKPHCNLFLIDSWVEDLATLFNQSKVYLYDSSEYWIQAGATEGFGLPPLEAMACGCTVFSSINDALSDYLDPSFNSYKLRVYSQEYDVQRILKVVNNWQDNDYEQLLKPYRIESIEVRFKNILSEINEFFLHQQSYQQNIPLIKKNKWQIIKKIINKIKR